MFILFLTSLGSGSYIEERKNRLMLVKKVLVKNVIIFFTLDKQVQSVENYPVENVTSEIAC